MAVSNPMGAQGPRQARTTGRLRNTLVNRASKGQSMPRNQFQGGNTPPSPPLPPEQVLQFQAQRQGLVGNFRDTLNSLRMARRQIRGAWRTARADIKTEREQGLSAAEQGAIAQGRLGSSTDQESRIGVKAGAERARLDARNQMLHGRQELVLERQRAQRAFQTGMTQLEAARAASKAQMTQQLYGEGFYDEPQRLPRLRPGDLFGAMGGASSGPSYSPGTPGYAPPTGSTPSPFLIRQMRKQRGGASGQQR